MKYIDKFLDGITMYRLLFQGLVVLAIIAIAFGFFGILQYSGLGLLFSALILAVVCNASNYLIAKALGVVTNAESAWISSLILFFVLFPLASFGDVWMLIVAGVLAMASKYILVIHKKHIFNPVAITIFLLGLFGSGLAGWWIGNSVMLLPVAVLGFLVLRKIKRFTLFFSFLVASVVSVSVVGLFQGLNLYDVLSVAFLSGPIIFMGAIMLTEPMTTPPTLRLQVIYGAIVGVLYGLQFHLGPLYSTPGFALIAGNLFSYIVSSRARLILTLVRKDKLSADVYHFIWRSDRPLSFKPGQYLEWTLGGFSADSRGNRRYFTIASSPTESELHLGVKFYPKSSAYKTKLLSLEPGDTIIASQLAGEFTLPEDATKKLVFISGGIGVTPFRSMIKFLVDTKEKRDITFFHSNRTPLDISYKELFDEAGRSIGIKTVYTVNDLAGASPAPNMPVGIVTTDMIRKEVPDYKERYFYLSGPHVMVSAFEEILRTMDVPRHQIKTDFFPGYV